MTVAEAVSTIRSLNPVDRARAMQEILEEYVEDGDESRLSEAEERHLDRVLVLDAADTSGGRDWEEIEAELIAKEEEA